MGLSCISETNGDFSPRVFNAYDEGVSLELSNTGWPQETRIMLLSGREKSLMISLAIWIQYTSVTDRQTDGRTPANG